MDFVFLVLAALFFATVAGLTLGCAALNRRRSCAACTSSAPWWRLGC